LQAEVCSRPIEVPAARRKNATHVRLIEDVHVIKALASRRFSNATF